MAPGAVKIPVLPVLDTLQKAQIPPVLLVPLVGVPGEHPEDGPEHKSIGKQRQYQVQYWHPDKHYQNAKHQTHAQNRHVQFVGTVAAQHEMAQTACHFCANPAQKI